MKVTTEKRPMGLTVHKVDSGNGKKNVLFLGAIHGNEPCGPVAMERLLKEFDDNKYVLKNGSVTFVPVCNPKAYQQKTREFEENLNRILTPGYKGSSYEAELAPHILQIIDEADVVFDIHSYRGPTPPFLMMDYYSEDIEQWAMSLSTRNMVTGWSDLYPGGGDTVAYAFAKGKQGLAIECGFHKNPEAINVAYKSMVETLQHFDMIPGKNPFRAQHGKNICRMVSLIKKPDEQAKLAKEWYNYEPFRKKDILYHHQGKEICAEFDGVVIMPKHQARAGQEWFYLAQNEAPKMDKIKIPGHFKKTM